MKSPKKSYQKYVCKICDYTTRYNRDLKKHIETKKHKRKLLETGGNPKSPTQSCLLKCSGCNNTYKSKSGLWKHVKKCKGLKQNKDVNIVKKEEDKVKNLGENNSTIIKEISKIGSEELISLLINQQRELEDKNKEIIELYKKTATVNNNTNNISINIFLNEHCKDAMNLTDFVENLKLSLEDLSYTGKYGYSKGIANILIKNLGDIDPTSRPIHCTDKKRMQFYVKDEDKWGKDEGNKKIDKSISDVTQKQYSYIKDWRELNKGYEESGEKIDEFFQITSNCNPKKDDNNKVIKKVADIVNIKEAISNIKDDD